MSYLESPVVPVVATRCACCNQPLVDSVSVELGIGPVCRRKYGMTKPETDPDWDTFLVHLDMLQEAGYTMTADAVSYLQNRNTQMVINALAYWAAVHAGEKEAALAAQAIHALGYHRFAAKIAENAGQAPVYGRISEGGEGDYVLVFTPFCRAAVADWRAIPSRRWDAKEKANRVHGQDLPLVRELVAKHFPNAIVDLPSDSLFASATETRPAPPKRDGRQLQGTRYPNNCVCCGEYVDAGAGWAYQANGKWRVCCDSPVCIETCGIRMPKLPADLPKPMSAEFAKKWLADHGIAVTIKGSKALRPGGSRCRGCHGTGRYMGLRGRCAACGGTGHTKERWISVQDMVRTEHKRMCREARRAA